MKVLVAVKRVIDANVRVRVMPDGTGVESDNVRMSMNPFDENAVEAAVQLKEAGAASEVVAVSIGPPKAEDQLRQALAMGADRGILVVHEGRLEPLAVAKLLKEIATEEAPDLILLGKQAIDDDAAQTGPMLAALLEVGQATFASAIAVEGRRARVTREVDGGTQVVETPLPAVITADLRLNTPRFAPLPAIMKARSKPLAKKSAADYGIDLSPRVQMQRTEAPPAGRAGVILSSPEELVEKLREARLV